MLGSQELLIILAITVVLVGAKKLPQLGTGLGRGVSNFKKSLHGDEDADTENPVDHRELGNDK